MVAVKTNMKTTMANAEIAREKRFLNPNKNLKEKKTQKARQDKHTPIFQP